jgi:hypothetical protein
MSNRSSIAAERTEYEFYFASILERQRGYLKVFETLVSKLANTIELVSN